MFFLAELDSISFYFSKSNQSYCTNYIGTFFSPEIPLKTNFCSKIRNFDRIKVKINMIGAKYVQNMHAC